MSATETADGVFELVPYLRRQADHVEEALKRSVQALTPLVHHEVGTALTHGVLSGGKRLRPILFATAFRATGGRASESAVYDMAVSLELIHAYSLMHDDLPCMDDAELRRGRPTTHRLHGEAATMKAGAALIPAAALQVVRSAPGLGLDEGEARAIARVLMGAAGAGGMVGGQGLDLLGEGQTLGAEALDTLHRHKTGALLTAALVMGGMAARASDATLGALRGYGVRVGLAFQVADDILDATSTAEELGKNPSDAGLEKSTYVALFGLDEARRRGEELVGEAVSALRASGLDSRPLEALAAYVMARRR